jgi:hypothetical protein
MKKTYEKPTLVKREQLPKVTAIVCVSGFHDDGTGICVI